MSLKNLHNRIMSHSQNVDRDDNLVILHDYEYEELLRKGGATTESGPDHNQTLIHFEEDK